MIITLLQSSSYQMMGQITKEVQVNLQWWATQLPTCSFSPIVKQEAKIVIESDASNLGWGAVCQGMRTEGRWTLVEAEHINYLELKAIFLAIATALPENQEWDKCPYQVRQPYSHCLHKQDGRSHNDTTLFISTTDLAVVPGSADYSSCRISCKEGEHNRRLGILPSQQQRLAAFTLYLRWNQQFARSIQLGLFCQQNQYPTAELLQLEAGPLRKDGGYFYSLLVSGSTLSIPTIQPNRQSSYED